MNFPKLYSIISIRDLLRPAFNAALVTKENTFVSDGYIMVYHKSTEIFDPEFIKSLPEEGIALEYDILKAMCLKTVRTVLLSEDKKTIILVPEKEMRSYHKNPEIRFLLTPVSDFHFPAFKAIIPDIDDIKSIQEISFSNIKLKSISDALGCKEGLLKMHFFGIDKSILIEPTDSDKHFFEARAILMPVLKS